MSSGNLLADRVTHTMVPVAHQRILVVDDEAAIRDLVGSYLRNEGFEVDEAVDGEDALRRAVATPPDLVVLDLRLPGMGGLDVLRELRQTSRVAVIVLSARADETDKLIGLELGADDYVTKPFSPRELVARVRAVLRRQQAGVDAAVDADDVRLDTQINETIWASGRQDPPSKFRVRAARFDEEGEPVVEAEFAE